MKPYRYFLDRLSNRISTAMGGYLSSRQIATIVEVKLQSRVTDLHGSACRIGVFDVDCLSLDIHVERAAH